MIPGNTPQEFFGAAAAAAAGGAEPGRSVRFNSADSAYLSRTPASAGNRKTWTWSGWVKRSKLGAVQYGLLGANNASFFFTFHDGDGADGLRVYSLDNAGSTLICNLITTNKFRDPSAWYHILLAIDTTQATDTNRVKIYVNNSQITTFSTAIYPSQNDDLWVNSATAHRLGALTNVGGLRFDGYLADCYLIDGQQLTPSSFGETNATTGQWVPRQFSGTYGTNGFKLTFSDNSNTTAATLGADTSGNGNNWTPSGFSVTAGVGNDSLRDTPTSAGTSTGLGGEVSGNYATLNPLISTSSTLSNGNLDYTSTGTYQSAYSTIGMSSGKWYFEGTCTQFATDALIGVGYAPFTTSTYVGGSATSWGYEGALGDLYTNSGGSSFGNTYTTNDIISVAFDADTGKLWFAKNGTWQASGNPANGTNPAVTLTTGRTYFFGVSAANTGKWSCNYGARAFAYTAPSGFSPLVDTLLPTPTIALPNTVMDVITYTGTGANATIPNVNTVPTSIGFKPDLVWIKGRSGATNHALYDLVRGVQKDLVSNSTAAETTQTTGLTAFGTNTFDIGTLAKLNTSSATYVAWCWDAGSDVSPTTNTSGTITSTVRANISAGFSIVSYTGNVTSGATVGHGLGVAPQLIIVKNRDVSDNWRVGHSSLTSWDYWLKLNSIDAENSGSGIFNSSAPTSSVFTLGNDSSVNGSGNKCIAYCFAPVAGYSSFGRYTGNGSSDGPFVYTGFRPKFIICKRTDTTGDWLMYDAVRNTYNVTDLVLYPNLSNAETQASTVIVDLLSNGFKWRGSGALGNASGGTYIYACFAESPLAYARAR